eukprot:GHVN01064706.1.p1 GENE.GHVN01064706.1~~GHVN01064706.1.p1  ORF type:complete len:403 (-),score=72.10 GHVN01064706.1:598-1782(-)
MSLLAGYDDSEESDESEKTSLNSSKTTPNGNHELEELRPKQPQKRSQPQKVNLGEKKRGRAPSSKEGFFANLTEVCQLKKTDEELMPPPDLNPKRKKSLKSSPSTKSSAPPKSNLDQSEVAQLASPVLTSNSLDPLDDEDDEDTVIPFLHNATTNSTALSSSFSSSSATAPLNLFSLANEYSLTGCSLESSTPLNETVAPQPQTDEELMSRPMVGPMRPRITAQGSAPEYSNPLAEYGSQQDQYDTSPGVSPSVAFARQQPGSPFVNSQPCLLPHMPLTNKQKEMSRMAQAIDINADSLKDPDWMSHSAVPRSKLEALAKKHAKDSSKPTEIDTRMWTPAGFLNMRTKEPNRMAKSKHQISWLAQESMDRELEMMEKTSHTRQSKYQTQMKYGW